MQVLFVFLSALLLLLADGRTCRSLSSAHQRLATVTRGSRPARHSRRPARHGSSNVHRDNTYDLFTCRRRRKSSSPTQSSSLSLSLYSSHFLTNRGTALFCFQSTVSDTLQSLSLCCPVERAQGEEDAVQRQRHALRIQISKLYYTEKRGASGRIPGIIRRNNNTKKRIEFVWFRKHEWGERILPL